MSDDVNNTEGKSPCDLAIDEMAEIVESIRDTMEAFPGSNESKRGLLLLAFNRLAKNFQVIDDELKESE